MDSCCTQGVHRSDSIALDAQARSIFLDPDTPDITPERLAAEISEIGPRDHGCIFARLRRLHLLEEAEHYLVYAASGCTASPRHWARSPITASDSRALAGHAWAASRTLTVRRAGPRAP